MIVFKIHFLFIFQAFSQFGHHYFPVSNLVSGPFVAGFSLRTLVRHVEMAFFVGFFTLPETIIFGNFSGAFAVNFKSVYKPEKLA